MNRALGIKQQSHLKDVEPKIHHNSKLQRARFDGVSMQRRPSVSERPFELLSNNSHNNNRRYESSSINNKSQPMVLSTQLFPSSLNQSNFIYNDVTKFPRSNSTSNIQSSTKKAFPKRNSDFIQNDISIESDTKKKKKPYSSRRKIFLWFTISLLIILIIVLSIVLPLELSNSRTTSSPTQSTTTQNSACISGSLICSTPIFYWNYYCNPTSYNYYSCCYLSPSSTQLTIEFILQEDLSHWSIDDVSATQNNGELIINGGFESNLTAWILTIPSNATSATYVQNQVNLSHSGSAYLYGGSQNAPAYLKQTFTVIQGQNINISFWWADGGNSVYIPGKLCQATVTMI